MPILLREDERIAAENDGNVMVPARESSAFIVIEAQFSFQVLVGALDSPTLHHQTDQLFC